jgi:hypothetical protein
LRRARAATAHRTASRPRSRAAGRWPTDVVDGGADGADGALLRSNRTRAPSRASSS